MNGCKRMHDRYNADDYLNVIIAVYEKHFNNAEIEELIQIQRDANESKTPTVSPALKEKLNKEGNTIMSEVVGGCGQVGAKLGADIGQEIGREHPEWVKVAKPAGDPESKK
jgi:DhnA family fructose-bisphosphate aldolase class Ia